MTSLKFNVAKALKCFAFGRRLKLKPTLKFLSI